MSDDPLVDTSRVDSYLRSRHRVEVLNSAWKPALAGAAGAVAIIGAVVVGVWVATPRFSYREIEIPRVVLRDQPINNLVPHDVEIEIPRIVTKEAPGPVTADTPKTPEEKKFVNQPEYKSAIYRGRIIKSVDGKALSFADRNNYWPVLWDEQTHTWTTDIDTNKAFITDPYIGDLAMCAHPPGRNDLVYCRALHNGQEIGIDAKPVGTSTNAAPLSPTFAATEMVAIDIKVGGYPVEAMVDTGCAWPMAVTKVYADALIRGRLATTAGASSTTLADGSVRAVGIITIDAINVEGRVLHDVEASVSPSGPVLLGLGALNRLGPYTITDGKLVFTGEQPA